MKKFIVTKWVRKAADSGLAVCKMYLESIHCFLSRREDVTSRSFDCFADKRFISSRKWLTFAIVVDQLSLNDVTLFVILKVVLCPFQIYGLLEYMVWLIWLPFNAILTLNQVFLLLQEFQVWNNFRWLQAFQEVFLGSDLFEIKCLLFGAKISMLKNILTSLSIDAISKTSLAYSSSLALYNWSYKFSWSHTANQSYPKQNGTYHW